MEYSYSFPEYSYRLSLEQHDGDRMAPVSVAEWTGDSPDRDTVAREARSTLQDLETGTLSVPGHQPDGSRANHPNPRFYLRQTDPQGHERSLASFSPEDVRKWEQQGRVPQLNTQSVLYYRPYDSDHERYGTGQKLKEFAWLEDQPFTPDDYAGVIAREVGKAGLNPQPDDEFGVYRITIDPDRERVDETGMVRLKEGDTLEYDPSEFPEDRRFSVRAGALEPSVRQEYRLMWTAPQEDPHRSGIVLDTYAEEPDAKRMELDMQKQMSLRSMNEDDRLSLVAETYNASLARPNETGYLVPNSPQCRWNHQVAQNLARYRSEARTTQVLAEQTVQELEEEQDRGLLARRDPEHEVHLDRAIRRGQEQFDAQKEQQTGRTGPTRANPTRSAPDGK